MAKLPAPPGADALRRLGAADDVVALAPHTVLWRVFDTVAPHSRPWNELRRFGPVASCRFDPHEPPPRLQDEGVLYTALDVPTALAEHYQTTRVIDRWRRAPHLVGFRPTRTLRVLDLTTTWPIRAGASHTINTGRRDVCRDWARTIRAAWPDLDGLWHTSSMTGRHCVTLWNPAADALPTTAAFSEPLAHAALDIWLHEAAAEIGYRLL